MSSRIDDYNTTLRTISSVCANKLLLWRYIWHDDYQLENDDITLMIFFTIKCLYTANAFSITVADTSLESSEFDIYPIPYPHSTLNCTIQCGLLFSRHDYVVDMIKSHVITLVANIYDMLDIVDIEDKRVWLTCNKKISYGWDGYVLLHSVLIHFAILFGEKEDIHSSQHPFIKSTIKKLKRKNGFIHIKTF
jgi:hypothetical protein